MYTCKYCGKEFEKQQSLAAHSKKCKEKQFFLNSKDPNDLVKIERQLTCLNCGKSYNISVSNLDFKNNNYSKYCCRSCANTRHHSNHTKEKIAKSVSEYYTNNDIKHKLFKQYICKNCGKSFTYNESHNRVYCCKTCKEQWLENNWKPKIGGYRKGSGRGKSGWYKGIYCDSSWELAFVIYHLDNNLNIQRCKEKRYYIFENKTHIYYPDFITDNGIIEIKGFKTKQWEAKELQNPDIKIIGKNEIKFYIDYCKKIYGIDYIKLYDNENPNKDVIDNHKNIWVSKQDLTIMIKPNLYDEYINNGWHRGRK